MCEKLGGYPSDYLKSHTLKDLRFDHMTILQLSKSEASGQLDSIKNPIENEKQSINKLNEYIEYLDREIKYHG